MGCRACQPDRFLPFCVDHGEESWASLVTGKVLLTVDDERLYACDRCRRLVHAKRESFDVPAERGDPRDSVYSSGMSGSVVEGWRREHLEGPLETRLRAPYDALERPFRARIVAALFEEHSDGILRALDEKGRRAVDDSLLLDVRGLLAGKRPELYERLFGDTFVDALRTLHRVDFDAKIEHVDASAPGLVLLWLERGEQRSIRALALDSGEVNWETAPFTPCAPGVAEAIRLRVSGERILFFRRVGPVRGRLLQAELVALDLAGAERWIRPLRLTAFEKEIRYREETEHGTVTGSYSRELHDVAITVENGVVFVADEDDLCAFRLEDGEELFRHTVAPDFFTGHAWFDGARVHARLSRGFLRMADDGTGEIAAFRDEPVCAYPEGLAIYEDGAIENFLEGTSRKTPRLGHTRVVRSGDLVALSSGDELTLLRPNGEEAAKHRRAGYKLVARDGGFACSNLKGDLLLIGGTGKIAKRVPLPITGDWSVWSVAPAPDGGVFVLLRELREWADVTPTRLLKFDSAGRQIGEWHTREVFSMACAPDGTLVVAGTWLVKCVASGA